MVQHSHAAIELYQWASLIGRWVTDLALLAVIAWLGWKAIRAADQWLQTRRPGEE